MRNVVRSVAIASLIAFAIVFSAQYYNGFQQFHELQEYSARVHLSDIGLGGGRHPRASAIPFAELEGVVSSFPEDAPGRQWKPLPVVLAPEQPTPQEHEAEQPSQPDRIVVVGKLVREDTSWVHEEVKDWQNAVYVVDDQEAKLHTKKNKGHEAVPYLTYITDDYDHLPSSIAFLHSHKDGYPQAWHNDDDFYDNVRTLHALNMEHVQKEGYVNLRCNPEPGCPVEMQLNRAEPNMNSTAENAFPHVWSALFGDLEPPKEIGVPCCGQFAVSRDQVRKRPLSDYQKYLDFLLETKLDDETSGRVFEYLWHIIFGKDPVHCPELLQCYCETFNRCDLAVEG